MDSPAAEGESGTEQTDIRESCFTQDRFVLFGRKNVQFSVNCLTSARRLLGIYAGGDREGGVSRQPERTLAFTLWKAEVGNHERRAWLEATVDFVYRASPLFERHEM